MEEKSLKASSLYLEKKNMLASLKEELAKLIADRDFNENILKKNLEALYVSEIGKNECELFKLECMSERLGRKLQLVEAALDQGQSDTVSIEMQLDEEYGQWEVKVEEMSADVKAGKKRLKDFTAQKEIKELQSIYISLIKRLHPDLNNMQTEKEKLLWNQAQQAYLAEDIEELRSINLIPDKSSDDAFAEKPVELVENQIKTIKKKIRSVTEFMDNLKSEFPFTVENELGDSSWIKERNIEIFKEQQKVKDKITENQDALDSLT